MIQAKNEGTGSKRKKNPRTARKEILVDLCCKFYLQGYTINEIQDKLIEDLGRKLDVRTIKTYIEDSVKVWTSQKGAWADQVTILELQKINQMEFEFWQGYQRSKEPIRTIKREFTPLDQTSKKKKRSVNDSEIPEGFQLSKEVHEIRQQNGDVRFILGAQECSRRRLEILGHTAAEKPKLKGNEEDDSKPEIKTNTRTIEFRVNGDKKPGRLTSPTIEQTVSNG